MAHMLQIKIWLKHWCTPNREMTCAFVKPLHIYSVLSGIKHQTTSTFTLFEEPTRCVESMCTCNRAGPRVFGNSLSMLWCSGLQNSTCVPFAALLKENGRTFLLAGGSLHLLWPLKGIRGQRQNKTTSLSHMDSPILTLQREMRKGLKRCH